MRSERSNYSPCEPHNPIHLGWGSTVRSHQQWPNKGGNRMNRLCSWSEPVQEISTETPLLRWIIVCINSISINCTVLQCSRSMRQYIGWSWSPCLRCTCRSGEASGGCCSDSPSWVGSNVADDSNAVGISVPQVGTVGKDVWIQKQPLLVWNPSISGNIGAWVVIFCLEKNLRTARGKAHWQSS